MSEAEQRLSTLRTTQEARIALNEGIDAVVRGEDVNLSPNSTDPLARVANDVATPSARQADFATEVRGQAHGQTDLTLRARVDGKEVGRIDYAEFDGKPSIQMIEVPPEARRQGVATSLLQELQSKYPDQEINWGSLTDQGAKLQEATKFRDVPSEHAPLFEQLKQAQDTERALDAERMAKWEVGKPLDQQTPEVQDITARQQDAINTASSLEEQLRGASPTKRIIDVPPKVPAQAPAIDTSKPAPEPRPEGIKQAEASVARPEDTKALAAQYGVDPATGAFPEEAQVAQLATEGRLTPDDAANLAQAEADYHAGASFGEALKSIVGCLL
jgi:GNAT superfamily N-acetyltransferase